MSTSVQFFPTFSESDNEKRREGASMGIPVFAVQEMCTCEGFDTNSKELTCSEDKRKDWTNDVEKIAQDVPVTIGINPLNVYPTGEPSKTGLQENGLDPFVQLSWKIFQASQIYEDGGPPYHCPGYIIGRNGLNVGLNSWTFEGFEFFRLPENGQGYSGWTKDIEFEGQTVTGPILLDTTTNESAPQSGTDVRIVGREALEKYDYVYSSSHNIVGFKAVKEEAEGA